MAAQRIVVTEFGTKAVPDPCQTIFQRYERWDGVMWTGLVWLRIGTGGELL
jgi:hypothetical protein